MLGKMGLNLRNKKAEGEGEGEGETDASKQMKENMREIPDECQFDTIKANPYNKVFYIDPSLIIQEIFFT